MSDSKVECRFFEGTKLFAQRGWSSVPRVGDQVRLGPSNAEVVFTVTGVVWDENADENQQANISIVRVA